MLKAKKEFARWRVEEDSGWGEAESQKTILILGAISFLEPVSQINHSKNPDSKLAPLKIFVGFPPFYITHIPLFFIDKR